MSQSGSLTGNEDDIPVIPSLCLYVLGAGRSVKSVQAAAASAPVRPGEL